MLESGIVIDRYAIEGILGRGGMAIVYRVRHSHLGSIHAMKVIELSAPAMRERLIEEGRVQSALRHPNIAAVTDLIDVGGAPALIMEYVNGPSLSAVIAQGELSLSQTDYLARNILAGMAAAHRHGLVHRDLKPSNIMMSIQADVVIPKIIDFGLVKKTDSSSAVVTRTGMTMGTPAYMAPEQVRDAKGIDLRADIFALGAILYEMVTGQRAFVGSDTFELFRAIADGTYIDPLELRPDLPARFVETIRKALQVDRDQRFNSCEELLQSWSAGDPGLLSDSAVLWDVTSLDSIHSREQERSEKEFADNVRSEETFTMDMGGQRPSSVDTSADETWDVEPMVDSIVAVESMENAGRVTLSEATSNFLLGLLLTLPFVIGAFSLLFGSPMAAYKEAPIGMVLIGGLTVVTSGVTMLLKCSRRERFGAWMVMPILILIVGTVATIIGVKLNDVVISHLILEGVAGTNPNWVGDIPKLASIGINKAMSTGLAAMSFSGIAFLITALIIASRAPGSWAGLRLSNRVRVILGVSVGLGGVFWTVAPLVRDFPVSGPEGLFFVFMSLCVLGLAAARVAEGSQDDIEMVRARWGVLLCGFTGMTLCLEAESIAALRQLFTKVGAEGSPIERVNNARLFIEIVENTTLINFTVWMLMALFVAILPMLGRGGISCPWPWRSWILPVTLLAIRFVLPGYAFLEIVRGSSLIIPAQEAAAVHELFGFVPEGVIEADGLVLTSKGIVVEQVDSGMALSKGDAVIAVNGRPVANVAELVEQIDMCWCSDNEKAVNTKCEFSWEPGEEECLSVGCTVRLLLSRSDELGHPHVVTESLLLRGQ